MPRFGLILIVCLAGCAVSDGRARDSLFLRAWTEDARNSEIQSRDEYLAWVDSFYAGSLFVPGWTRRQTELVTADSRETLDELGRLLAAEWAKDNSLRKVDSDLLVRVAAILVKARDAACLAAVCEALVEDAQAVVRGDLEASAIHAGRYFPRFTNVPSWNSLNAVRSSSCEFMTIGPYHAIGSWSGRPDTSRNRTGCLPVDTATLDPGP